MKPQTSPWFALAVLFCINAMNFYDRLIPGAVGEKIKTEFGLSDTKMGALGTAFILLYATIGIPLGRLSDKHSRSRLLAVGVFAWSLMTAASGLARNFAQLVALRLAVGVGEATCAPASTSLIGDLFPPKRRAYAMSVFMLGLPVGVALCFFISGYVANRWDWRAAFYVALIPGLLCALGAFFISEPARGGAETHAVGARRRAGSPYLLVLRTPTLRWIILSGALHNFNMNAMGSFLVSYLIRVHKCDIGTAAMLATFIYGLSGVPGLIVGGYLGDRQRRVNGRMIIAAIAIALAVPPFTMGLRVEPTHYMMCATLLGVACTLMYVYYSTVYSTIQDVVEPSLRGTAMALYFFAMYLLGGALGPIGLGKLSDIFARRAAEANGLALDTLSKVEAAPYVAAGLQSAIYAIPIVAAVLAIVLALGARTVTADAEKLHRWMESGDEAHA